MDEFPVYVVSNASMDFYPDNTLSSFTNYYRDQINLDGDWRVGISSINYPSIVKNIVDGRFIAYTVRGDEDERHVELYNVEPGLYKNVGELIYAITKIASIEIDYAVNEITGKLTLVFNASEGLSFPTREIPNILGFEGEDDESMYVFDWIHIGRSYNQRGAILTGKFGTTGNYPVDIIGDTNLVFVYINIIDYQYVGDTKSPLLKIYNRKCKIRNGEINPQEIQSNETFTDLELKKLLTTNIQSIRIELRTSTGELLPFLGTGRTTVTLIFRKHSN